MDPLVIAGIFAAFVAYLIWQRRSPRPFAPWMTPLLHAPWRRRFFSPEVASDYHGLAVGMTVLEVGPGDGYLTLAALDRVTPSGRLICLDVQHGMLRKLRGALGARTPSLVCASGSQLPFRSGVFDVVFLAHVLGEIPDRAGALTECARVLRPTGTLAITEGVPDPDFIRQPRLVSMAADAGLRAGEIPDRTGALTEYARVLRPTGTLAITEGVPDPDFIRQPRLVSMASAAGFRPGERLGRVFHYTQRFHREESAAQQGVEPDVE